MNKSSPGALSRRDFIKAGAAAGLGALLSTPSHPANEAAVGITSSVGSHSGDKTLLEFKVPPIDPVRIGFVGVGDMGSDHV